MKEFRLFGINRLIEEFINPLFANLVKPFWGQLAMMLAPPLLEGVFGGNDDPSAYLLDEQKLREGQAQSQSLVDEQLGMARQMQDPESEMNQRVLQTLSQQASEQGAQTASSASKLAAQTGVGGGQALMAQRAAMDKEMGGVEGNFQNMLNQRFKQGGGLMQNMTTQQVGLESNMQNVQMANTNAQNMMKMQEMEFGSSGGGGGIMDMLGNIPGFDLGTIGQGGGGFMGNFGTGSGWLSGLGGGTS